MGDARARVTGGVAALLVVAAALPLTNQTPRCYERREFRGGRVEHREWVPEEGVENVRLGGSGGRAVVSQESGCTTDELLWWESSVAGALLLVALAWVTVRAPAGAARAGASARFVLAVLSVVALLSAAGLGAFVAPLLIPLQWLAARRSGRWGRAGWTLLAAASAWLLGLLLWSAASREPGAVGGVFGLLVAVTCGGLFALTARPSGRASRA